MHGPHWEWQLQPGHQGDSQAEKKLQEGEQKARAQPAMLSPGLGSQEAVGQ